MVGGVGGGVIVQRTVTAKEIEKVLRPFPTQQNFKLALDRQGINRCHKNHRQLLSVYCVTGLIIKHCIIDP